MGNMKRTQIASKVFAKLGGPTAVAKLLNVDRTVAYKWLRPKDKGGSGGKIPLHHQEALINAGLGITPEDFWDQGDCNGKE